MEIAAWCPGCEQKYSVSRAHLDKQFRCKKCNQLFRVRDATRAPGQASQAHPSGDAPNVNRPPNVTAASQSSLGQAVEPIEIVAATVVEASVFDATIVEPESVGQGFDDGLGLPTSSASNPYPYSNQPEVRHVANPRMLPAVLAAIFIPLILGGICFGINAVRTFRAVAQQAHAQRDREALRDLAMSEPEERQSNPVNVNRNRRPARNKPSTPPKFGPSNTNSAENANAAKARIAEIRAESERRSAKMKADHEARNAKWEKEKLAREEARRIKKEDEAYLKKLESEADQKPYDGMIARIKIDSWGVKKMTISNDGMVYAVTPNEFLVYDCERKRDVDRQKTLNSIDRFSTLCLSNDGSMLAVGGQRGGIELQKVSGRGKLKSIGRLAKGNRTITQLVFNSDQSRLVSFDRDKNFCIWDVQKKTNVKKSKLEGEPRALFVNSEQNTITLAASKTWTTFSFENGQELESGSFPFHLNPGSIYSPNGSRIFEKSGSWVEVLKLDEKQPLRELRSSGVQWEIATVNEEELLVGGTYHLYKFNWKTKKLLKVWSLPEIAYVQKIAVSPNSSLMAISYGSTKQDIFVFDLNKD